MGPSVPSDLVGMVIFVGQVVESPVFLASARAAGLTVPSGLVGKLVLDGPVAEGSAAADSQPPQVV